MKSVIEGYNPVDIRTLLSYFNGDVAAIDTFLKTYHPDLFYLRAYLKCIGLVKSDEYEIAADEDVRRVDEIEQAKSNAIISKKLDLKFRGKDY